MFILAVEGLGEEDQRKEWEDMIRNFKMLGCYAQTELGHGSNVAVN